MIKYFSVGQKPVVEFDEWVGVLNLATMWLFQEVRSLLLQKISVSDSNLESAIIKLSDLIKQKTVTERIVLAREFRVVEWLRDAYLELTQGGVGIRMPDQRLVGRSSHQA